MDVYVVGWLSWQVPDNFDIKQGDKQERLKK